MSEDEENSKVDNKANEFSPYWDSKDIETKGYVQSSDRPEFHCYISFQKSGTETEAEHYEGQDSDSSSDTSSNTSSSTDSSTDSTS